MDFLGVGPGREPVDPTYAMEDLDEHLRMQGENELDVNVEKRLPMADADWDLFILALLRPTVSWLLGLQASSSSFCSDDDDCRRISWLSASMVVSVQGVKVSELQLRSAPGVRRCRRCPLCISVRSRSPSRFPKSPLAWPRPALAPLSATDAGIPLKKSRSAKGCEHALSDQRERSTKGEGTVTARWWEGLASMYARNDAMQTWSDCRWFQRCARTREERRREAGMRKYCIHPRGRVQRPSLHSQDARHAQGAFHRLHARPTRGTLALGEPTGNARGAASAVALPVAMELPKKREFR